MAVETSPAFQFYVKEWRSSRPVMRMTLAERGAYLEMLCEQWENLKVPSTPEACAELIGGATVAEWRKVWPAVRRAFVEEPDGLVNLRLEKERHKQRSHSRRAADKGKAGATARWQKAEGKRAEAIAQASASHVAVMPAPSIADGTSTNDHSFAFALPIAIATAERESASVSPFVADASRDPFTDPVITERAGRFIERYGDLYQKHRKAHYHSKPHRDYQAAVELCTTWREDARLDKLAAIFLTTDHKFAAEGSRTVPQFAALASWCDGKLAEWEQQQRRPA